MNSPHDLRHQYLSSVVDELIYLNVVSAEQF